MATIARKPRTTMTAIAQCGKLESELVCRLPGLLDAPDGEEVRVDAVESEDREAMAEAEAEAEMAATEVEATDAVETAETEATEDATASATVVSVGAEEVTTWSKARSMGTVTYGQR